MMCNVCWKEFKGWCRAFTRTEILLSLLEFILLIIFIGGLVFVIIHLLVCTSWSDNTLDDINITTTTESHGIVTTESYEESTNPVSPSRTTLGGVQCTWSPSQRTPAGTRYYQQGYTPTEPITSSSGTNDAKLSEDESAIATRTTHAREITITTEIINVTSSRERPQGLGELEDESEGGEADGQYMSSLVAVVRAGGGGGVGGGGAGAVECAGAVVGAHWTLTAATCIQGRDAINDLLIYSTDAGGRGGSHRVVSVHVHPQYHSRAPAPAAPSAPAAPPPHDLALLRAAAPLPAAPLALPAPLDALLLTPAERLHTLHLRERDRLAAEGSGWGVRSVRVYSEPGARCGGRGRRRGERGARGRGERGASICAGVRSLVDPGPCAWDAGTPLVRARVLLGVLAGAGGARGAVGAGGGGCARALYVDVATHARWIRSVVGPGY